MMLGLYEDGRHEMLNEINRSEVFEDILRSTRGPAGPEQAAGRLQHRGKA
ncbi:MAG: hypothetical protein ACLSAP_06755 [Oscillospiraceae bacterium]